MDDEPMDLLRTGYCCWVCRYGFSFQNPPRVLRLPTGARIALCSWHYDAAVHRRIPLASTIRKAATIADIMAVHRPGPLRNWGGRIHREIQGS